MSTTVPDVPPDPAHALTLAANRVRCGFLDTAQREALAALLLIAGASTLPTPVTASLANAVTALTRRPREDGAKEGEEGGS